MYARPRLVLIDDDRQWLEALSEYLGENGFAVETATDAAAGLALLADDMVSLAVVDFHMPGLDGLELVRQVRRNRFAPPVLLVSSDDDPTLATRALNAGAQGFVAKTASPRLLLQAVRQAARAADHPGVAGLKGKPWERLLPGPSRTEQRKTEHSFPQPHAN